MARAVELICSCRSEHRTDRPLSVFLLIELCMH